MSAIVETVGSIASILARRGRRAAPLMGLLMALGAGACAPLAHTDAVPGGDAAVMLRVGDAAAASGDHRTALPIYRRAHRLAPLEPAPLVRIGDSLNALGAWQEAGDVWAEALRLDADDPDALEGYATALTVLDQPQLALEYWRRALALGESAALYRGMGVAYDMAGQPGEAQAAYRDGLRLEHDLGLLNNLGLSLALSGEYDEAIVVLEEAVGMAGAGPRHRQNLAMAYALAGLGERALAVARHDLDEASLIRNLGFYETVRRLPDHGERVAAVGTWTAGAWPGAVPARLSHVRR